MGLLAGYSVYKKGSVIATTDGAQTMYQMKLTVGESSGSPGCDVHCEGNCYVFPNDIRFTGADGVTKHDYWMQSLTGATPNRVAIIWIEIAAIPTSGAIDCYMYYGKSGDSGDSVFDDTFILGELWDSATIDTNKWAIISSGVAYTIDPVNHYLEWTDITSGGAWVYKLFVSKQVSFPAQFIVEDAYSTGTILMSINQDDADNIWQHGFVLTDTTTWGTGKTARFLTTDVHAASYEEHMYAYIDGIQSYYAVHSYSGWVDFGIRMWKLSSNLYIEEGGIVRKSGTHTGGLDYVKLEGAKYSTYPIGTHMYGAFKIRKFSSPEPTWGTWGGAIGGKTRSCAFIIG